MAKNTKSTQSQKKVQSKPAQKGKKPVRKERGWLLSAALILIILHGLLGAVLYYTQSKQDFVPRPVILVLMSIHFLANIAAAFGIWNWKKWGIYVFVGSELLAVVLGLITVGIWSLFYMFLPLVILGWLLRTKWDYFES
jgi:hypothetical protein